MTEKRITVSILYRTICLTDRNRDSFTLKLKSEHLLPVSSPRLFLFFLYEIVYDDVHHDIHEYVDKNDECLADV